MGKKAAKPRAVQPRNEQPAAESQETPPTRLISGQVKIEEPIASQPERKPITRAASATKMPAKPMINVPDETSIKKTRDQPDTIVEKQPVHVEPRVPVTTAITPTLPARSIPATNADSTLVESHPPEEAIESPGPRPGKHIRLPFIESIKQRFIHFIENIKQSFSLLFKEMRNKESWIFLMIAILVIGTSIGLALLLGQATHLFFQTNASNIGHLYGIITSSIAFYIFARYLRRKKDLFYVRRFFVFYFIIYFVIVMLFLLGLQQNIIYFISTLGNSFILFSAYTLIIFILSPEILGVLGTGGDVRKLFLSGQHVRLIMVYLFISIMQITGFSLLDFAIQMESGGRAYIGIPGLDNMNPDPANFGTLLDFFYFSMITFATIGYGDITPYLPVAELSSVIQALLSHVISILFLAVLLLYLSSNTSTTTSTLKEERNER